MVLRIRASRPYALARDLTAGSSQTDMAVTWNDVSGETGYEIQVSPDDSTWADLDTAVAANATSKTQTGLTAGVTRYYRIRAKNSGGNSSYSSSVSGSTLPDAPSTPTGLAASGSSQTDMAVTWNDVSGETGYEIQVSSDDCTWSDLDTAVAANATSKTQTGLTASVTRYYRIRAKNSGGSSSYSASANGTTQAASSSITVTANNGGVSWSKTVSQNITWTSSGITGNVKIEKSVNSGSTWTTISASAPNTGTYTIGSCTAFQTISSTARLRVTSVNDSAISDTSDANFTINGGPCS